MLLFANGGIKIRRRSDRLVRCEECETIVEESITTVIPFPVVKEEQELFEYVTPLNLSEEQKVRQKPSVFPVA